MAPTPTTDKNKFKDLTFKKDFSLQLPEKALFCNETELFSCQLFLSLGDAFTCKASPFEKQSTGLFFNSPLAKRFVTAGLCPTPHKGCQPLT
jgi:hypothetical protein